MTGLLEDIATVRRRPGAAALGGALGGFVPIAAYVIVHHELRSEGGTLDMWRPIAPIVLACLAFSVRTVYEWGNKSFDDRFKAGCLVVALEGVMVLSDTPWLGCLALAYLVLINAIATACTLISAGVDPKPQQVVATEPPAPARSLPRASAKNLESRLVAKAGPA